VSGPSTGRACVFPFTYSGKVYTECAKWIHGETEEGEFWCSTKVDKFGRHITGMGHYGFCSSNCPGMRGHEEYFSVNSSSVEAERNVPVIFEDEIPVILGYPN